MWMFGEIIVNATGMPRPEDICCLAQGAVTLQGPGYADSGPFAINVWVKSANTSEQGPQYIFSHESANSSSGGVYNAWQRNMVLTRSVWYLPSLALVEGLQLSYIKHSHGLIRCALDTGASQ